MVGAIIFGTIIIVVIIVSLVSVAWTCFSFVGWVPTVKKDLKRILKVINLKPGQTFCELGAGNGRVSFFIGKKFPKSKIIALELALPLFIIGKIREFFYSGNNVTFKLKNLFKQNLSDVDVVYVFGLPSKLNTKLKEKFEKDLKSGAKVVSYVFEVKGLTPKTVNRPQNQDKAIYVYEF